MNTRVVTAWAAAGAVLVVIFVVVLISDASARSNYSAERDEANARVRLYSAAQGNPPARPSVERKLGVDVRDYMRQHGNQLSGFRGDSNTYGGIAEALGEDPFDGVNCVECGPLKPEWEERLESVVQGEVKSIVDLAEVPDEPQQWKGSIGLLTVVWAMLLPVLFTISRIVERRRRNARNRVYSLEDRQLLHALDEQLKQGEDPELLLLKTSLQNALNERADAGDDIRNETRITTLKAQSRDRLDALEAGNRYLEGGE